MKGKPWTYEEEKELRRLVKSGISVSLIATTMAKTVDSIVKKCSRLGLEVVDGEKFSNPTTSRVELPTKLLTVEQALLCLRGAMKGLERMGIDKTEILRMRSLVQVSKIYLEKFAEYLDYRRIERELVELRKEVAGLRNEAEKDARTRDR